MKIRFLIANGYPAGGTIRTTISNANALSARGHDVEIISVLRRRTLPTFPIAPDVRMRPLVDTSPAARDYSRWLEPFATKRHRLRTWLLEQPSRLMHTSDVRYSTFNLYSDIQLLRFLRSVTDGVLIGTRPTLNLAIARFVRPSVIRIGQEHLHRDKHRPPLKASFMKYYPRLDAFATLTPGDAVAYQEMLGHNARVVAMPNAAPDMGGVRATLDNRIVIAAGRLTRQKGFDMLIPAFAQVAAKHPDWQLHIYGVGERQEELEHKIAELEVGDHVKLLGFTKELPRKLAEASIYALSSRFEGFPMVLLEAMMCGLPAVAFDCPTGPRDLIDHGEDGLIVPFKDVDAMAAGIIELIEDEQRRKTFGARSYDKAQQYTTSGLAEQWEQLFVDIARRRGITL
ncbi:MAG: glycosyltransferase family 4 protein [Actinobacteria bacterium]|nr:glycosyltransferase family 4 protein [Actinomycetota bacterium]